MLEKTKFRGKYNCIKVNFSELCEEHSAMLDLAEL